MWKQRWVQIVFLFLGVGVVFGGGVAIGARLAGQDMAIADVYESEGGTTIKMLLEESNLGGTEIEIGEITFSPGTSSGSHPHGSTEIFYVLSGELEHVVNGKSYRLTPGQLGFVRPPDQVQHITGAETTKALVIWAPGGEAHRIVDNWEKQ